MNNFSSRLKEALKYRGMKAIELSNKTGIGKSSISDWMSGKYEAKQDKVFLLAKALGVDEAWLMGLDVPMIPRDDILSIYNKLEEPRQEKVYTYAEEQLHEQESTIEENNICYLPTVDNSAAAANPAELAYGDVTIENQQFVDVPDGADFAVPIHGNSMEPVIQDGDYVFVKTQNHIENGEIALVEIDGDGVTCKKIFFNPETGSIILHSLNAEYDDREINPDRVRIIGKVLL